MKKNWYKLLSLCMAAGLLLSACGTTASTSTGSTATAGQTAGSSDFVYSGTGPITDAEDAHVSILAMNSYYTTVDIKEAPIVTSVIEQAGITVDWTLVDPTNYEDAVSPMLAAGTDLPDIVLLPNLDENMIYLSSGMFTPLDNYFDSMPNFTKWLDENPVIKASLTAPDGHIYYVPFTNVTYNYQPQLMYNMKWLADAGFSEVPTTLDEFVELLRYYKENDMNGNGDAGDETPMSVMASFLPYMFGPAFGLDLVSGFYVDENGEVQYAYYEDEKYLNYLTFLNELYAEGLLEIEYTTLTRDQIIERFANDQTGVTFDYGWQQSMTYSPQLPYYDGTPETGVVAAKPLSGTHEGYYIGRQAVGGIYGITSKSDDPELAAKFLDFAMSEPNQISYVWGIEGESYVVNEDGSYSYTEAAGDNEWLQSLGINPSVVFPAQQSVEATDALVAEWHVEADKAIEPYVVDPWPFIYSTTEEADVVSQYLVDIQTYVEEMGVSFVTGATPLSQYDSYLSNLQAMNIEALLEIRTAQYERYKEAMEG